MKNANKFYESILLNNIDLSEYKAEEKTSLKEVLNTVYEIHKREYVHQNNQHLSKNELFSEWLQGLPSVLTVPFYNYDILKAAKEFGFDLPTDDKEDYFLNNYFNNVSRAFFNLKNNL